MVKTTKPSTGAGCLALFALPFAAVGVAVFGWAGYDLASWWRMQAWEPVPARVLEASLDEHSDDDGTTYEARATYTYRVAGRDYTGRRVAVSSGADNVGDFHERLYAELRAAADSGAPTTAFVDPENPAEATLNRELRWLLFALKSIFALSFGAVGFGLLIGARYAAKKLAAEQALQARHPNAPWRWRPDWASGRIESSSRTAAYGITAFAVLWNLISLPALLFVPGEVASGNTVAAVALLFPLVGAGLAAAAIRAWWQLRRFKTAMLDLDRTPIPRGGRLRAMVQVPAAVPVTTSFRLSLTCSETVQRRSGGKTETSERLLWQTDASVLPRQCQMGVAFTAIPVDIALPSDQPEASTSAGSAAIRWRLDVYGECPGPDFSARFDLPVFGSEAPDANAPFSAPAPLEEPSAATLAALGIVRERLPSGGERWTLRRGRHRHIALMLSVFAIAWTAATAALFFSDAPRLIPWGFSLFAVLLDWAALDLWLTERRVTLERGLLTLERRGLLRAAPVEIPTAWIRGARAVRGMQYGQKLFFDVKLEANDRKHTAASAIGDYAVAAWLAEHWSTRAAAAERS